MTRTFGRPVMARHSRSRPFGASPGLGDVLGAERGAPPPLRRAALAPGVGRRISTRSSFPALPDQTLRAVAIDEPRAIAQRGRALNQADGGSAARAAAGGTGTIDVAVGANPPLGAPSS